MRLGILVFNAEFYLAGGTKIYMYMIIIYSRKTPKLHGK